MVNARHTPFNFRLEKRPASLTEGEDIQRGPLSSAKNPAKIDDSDDDVRLTRPRRLNVAEKLALSVETQVCPSVYP